ncbi:MAG: glycerophosphodiester phosphodiesterase family protein [Actinomycetota bacterium]
MAPLIYAHRGASFDFPEMSREAYLAAVTQGADGFECDLRLTKDKVIVCWHNASMKRIADCDLVIAESTYEEIIAAYPVLALEELIEIALEFRKDLALETKHPVPTHGAIERELLKVLEKYKSRITDAEIDVSIMSFSWFAIARVRRSGWNTVLLAVHRWFFLFSPATSIGPSISAIREVKNIHKGRRKIFVWTANTESDILLCKIKGVDVMMTDRPAFARAILESA